MLASTVTVGGHYYVDVMAGAIVALVVIRSTAKAPAALPAIARRRIPRRRDQMASRPR